MLRRVSKRICKRLEERKGSRDRDDSPMKQTTRTTRGSGRETITAPIPLGAVTESVAAQCATAPEGQLDTCPKTAALRMSSMQEEQQAA